MSNDTSALIDARLGAHASVLEQFRGQVAALFAAMHQRVASDGRPLSRKPNVSLRLIANGEPVAKLIVLPHWSSWHKCLDRDTITTELIEERVVDTPQGHGKVRRRAFTAQAAGWPGWRACRYYSSTALADLARVVDTITAFVTDTRAVLARNHDYCALCGRHLTDELSRSRGIGPECIQIAPMLVVLAPAPGVDHTIVAREDQDATVAPAGISQETAATGGAA
jgi:hypothetical protein